MRIFEISNRNPVRVEVYHGSGYRFDHFDQRLAKLKNDFYGGGIGYFTDSISIARSYARASSKETKTPYVYTVLLNLKNVFDINNTFSGTELTKFLPKDIETFARSAGLVKIGVDKYNIITKLQAGNLKLSGQQIFKGLSQGMTNTAQARNHLIHLGYDGLRYNGGMGITGATQHNVYIPYDNNAITILDIAAI